MSLASLSVFASPDEQKGSIDFDMPVVSFDSYGQKIQLYITNYVGTYVDQNGTNWIFVPNERSIKEAQQRILLDEFSNWKELGEFKPLFESTREEINLSRKMDPSAVHGVFVDARGSKWAFVPDPSKSQGGSYIRLEVLTPDQMVRTFAGKFDIPAMVVDSFKTYTPEQIKFSTALFAVNMAKCFGGGIAGLPFSNAKSFTPTCVDDFIHHLTDPKGMVGFYFFILFNRGATQGLNQIAVILAANAKNPQSALVLRQKLAPLFGYLGMAAGSLASSVASHILSAPSWGECFRLFNAEGFTSQPCREAYTYFLSVEGFWGDFVGSTGEMITAAILAHGTQVALKFSAGYAVDSALVRGSVKFLGGSVRAMEMTGKAGAGIVKAVRMVGSASIISGAPGVVIFVVTQVGSYVLFLAWDEVLRAPFMQEYNSITKSWDIDNSIKVINNAMEEGKKLSFEKPYLPETCKKVYQRIPRGTFKMVCTTAAPLDEGLTSLKISAAQYRKKVLMDGLEEATAAWRSKVSQYLSRYRVSKMLLEYIHEIKEQNVATAMDVRLAGMDYVKRWKAALTREVPDFSVFKQTVLRQFANIDYLIYQVDAANKIADDTSWVGRAKAFLFNLNESYQKVKNPEFLNARAKLRRALVENKQYIEDNIYGIFNNPDMMSSSAIDVCQVTRETCQVYTSYLKVNFEKLRIDIRSDYMTENNNGIVQFLADSMGTKAVNEVLFDFFCADRDDFSVEGTNNNGRAAAFHPPTLIKAADREAFLRDNCTYSNGTPKMSFSQEDFAKTWVYKGRSYADPIDVVIDAQTPIVTGFNTITAEALWKEKAFTPTMQFMANSTFNYQTLLQDRYAPLIPEDTPESLIRRSSAQMRGSDLDYKIGSYIAFNSGARPSLSQSLMGQYLFVLNHIKYSMGGDTKTYELADKLALSMAKLILTYRKLPDPSAVASQVRKLQTDIAQLQLIDGSLQYTPLESFQETMKEMVLPPKTTDEIIANQSEVHQLSSDLYKHLTGIAFDDMMAEKELYKAGLTPEQQGKLSKEEYKKYIYFKLLYDNTNDIVINYLSLDLYEKLSLKPLLEIKTQE